MRSGPSAPNTPRPMGAHKGGAGVNQVAHTNTQLSDYLQQFVPTASASGSPTVPNGTLHTTSGLLERSATLRSERDAMPAQEQSARASDVAPKGAESDVELLEEPNSRAAAIESASAVRRPTASGPTYAPPSARARATRCQARGRRFGGHKG